MNSQRVRPSVSSIKGEGWLLPEARSLRANGPLRHGSPLGENGQGGPARRIQNINRRWTRVRDARTSAAGKATCADTEEAIEMERDRSGESRIRAAGAEDSVLNAMLLAVGLNVILLQHTMGVEKRRVQGDR